MKKQLKNVNPVGEGRFVVNEHVIIHSIDMGSNGIEYSFDWDQNHINEKDASIIAEEFIQDTIDGIMKMKTKGS